MVDRYYDVLECSRTASLEDISKAYRKVSLRCHPDRRGGSEEALQYVARAYEVLSDEKKRAAYDQYGHAAEEMGGGYEHVDPFEAFRQAFGQNRGFSQRSGGFQAHGQGIDLEDLLDDFFSGGRPSSNRRQNRGGPRKGPDVQLGLRLSFMEAAKGVANKEVEWYEITRDGRRGERQTTVMEVPPGVDSGMQIRLQGKGGRGEQGAPRGDLYLQVEVEPDDYFERDGADIHVKVDLDMVQAALGSTVKVLTLDGFVDLTVPAGTQPDAKFRLKNKGLPVMASPRRGAQYVHIHVTVPTALTPHQRSLLQARRPCRSSRSRPSSSSSSADCSARRRSSAPPPTRPEFPPSSPRIVVSRISEWRWIRHDERTGASSLSSPTAYGPQTTDSPRPTSTQRPSLPFVRR